MEKSLQGVLKNFTGDAKSTTNDVLKDVQELLKEMRVFLSMSTSGHSDGFYSDLLGSIL